MKRAGLYIQSFFYSIAGINHFWHPVFYRAIMPPWLPWHDAIIYFSGFCETVLGLLLLPASTRRMAASLIILLLIAIFPANIQMTVNYFKQQNPSAWISILRLPLQFILIWWAYIYTKKQTIKP